MLRYFDGWSIAVITITFGLFIAATAVTGSLHDLLLEAGVFLVSVKLIQMAYKNSAAHESLHRKLDAILARLKQTE